MITMPLLLVSGINPFQALATNKLQACVGSFVSAAHYYHQGLVDMRESRTLMLIATFFGAVGAILVQFPCFQKSCPFVMIAVGGYALLSTQLLIGEFFRISHCNFTYKYFYAIIF